MSEQATCNTQFTVNQDGTLSCSDWLIEPYTQTMAQSIQQQAEAIEQLNDNMTEFFDVDPAVVASVSGLLFVLFILGNMGGKMAHLLRK